LKSNTRNLSACGDLSQIGDKRLHFSRFGNCKFHRRRAEYSGE
jgi:hypothetical protein